MEQADLHICGVHQPNMLSKLLPRPGPGCMTSGWMGPRRPCCWKSSGFHPCSTPHKSHRQPQVRTVPHITLRQPRLAASRHNAMDQALLAARQQCLTGSPCGLMGSKRAPEGGPRGPPCRRWESNRGSPGPTCIPPRMPPPMPGPSRCCRPAAKHFN